jgi:hypothetical protein
MPKERTHRAMEYFRNYYKSQIAVRGGPAQPGRRWLWSSRRWLSCRNRCSRRWLSCPSRAG